MTNHQMEELRIKKQQEEQARAKAVQTMTARSGEVFYVINGVLKSAVDQTAFEKEMKKIESDRLKAERLNQKFFIEIEGIRYGYCLSDRKAIIARIRTLDEKRQMAELERYFKEYQTAERG